MDLSSVAFYVPWSQMYGKSQRWTLFLDAFSSVCLLVDTAQHVHDVTNDMALHNIINSFTPHQIHLYGTRSFYRDDYEIKF